MLMCWCFIGRIVLFSSLSIQTTHEIHTRDLHRFLPIFLPWRRIYTYWACRQRSYLELENQNEQHEGSPYTEVWKEDSGVNLYVTNTEYMISCDKKTSADVRLVIGCTSITIWGRWSTPHLLSFPLGGGWAGRGIGRRQWAEACWCRDWHQVLRQVAYTQAHDVSV